MFPWELIFLARVLGKKRIYFRQKIVKKELVLHSWILFYIFQVETGQKINCKVNYSADFAKMRLRFTRSVNQIRNKSARKSNKFERD